MLLAIQVMLFYSVCDKILRIHLCNRIMIQKWIMALSFQRGLIERYLLMENDSRVLKF